MQTDFMENMATSLGSYDGGHRDIGVIVAKWIGGCVCPADVAIIVKIYIPGFGEQVNIIQEKVCGLFS